MATNAWKRHKGAREPGVLGARLIDPADWRAEDIAGSEQWIYRLSAAEIAEIEDAVSGVEARGLDIKDVTKDDFPLPSLAAGLAEVKDELFEGRGIAMIRGLPVEGRTRAQVAAAFWGVGAHLGRQISQNRNGHVLGHVKDLGGDYAEANTRGYFTNARMGFHCDQCDVLALACLHGAKSGGDHLVLSSVALYNEILARRPELAIELGGYFYRSRKGEIPPGETEPFAKQRVFGFQDGYFAGRGVSSAIDKGQDLPGVPKLTARQREALDLFRTLAVEMAVEIPFERGDMFFLMNHVTLHSRTSFEDWPDPDRKRHLLRMWLTMPDRRPLPPYLADQRDGVTVEGTVLTAPLDVV